MNALPCTSGERPHLRLDDVPRHVVAAQRILLCDGHRLVPLVLTARSHVNRATGRITRSLDRIDLSFAVFRILKIPLQHPPDRNRQAEPASSSRSVLYV